MAYRVLPSAGNMLVLHLDEEFGELVCVPVDIADDVVAIVQGHSPVTLV